MEDVLINRLYKNIFHPRIREVEDVRKIDHGEDLLITTIEDPLPVLRRRIGLNIADHCQRLGRSYFKSL